MLLKKTQKIPSSNLPRKFIEKLFWDKMSDIPNPWCQKPNFHVGKSQFFFNFSKKDLLLPQVKTGFKIRQFQEMAIFPFQRNGVFLAISKNNTLFQVFFLKNWFQRKCVF